MGAPGSLCFSVGTSVLHVDKRDPCQHNHGCQTMPACRSVERRRGLLEDAEGGPHDDELAVEVLRVFSAKSQSGLQSQGGTEAMFMTSAHCWQRSEPPGRYRYGRKLHSLIEILAFVLLTTTGHRSPEGLPSTVADNPLYFALLKPSKRT